MNIFWLRVSSRCWSPGLSGCSAASPLPDVFSEDVVNHLRSVAPVALLASAGSRGSVPSQPQRHIFAFSRCIKASSKYSAENHNRQFHEGRPRGVSTHLTLTCRPSICRPGLPTPSLSHTANVSTPPNAITRQFHTNRC